MCPAAAGTVLLLLLLLCWCYVVAVVVDAAAAVVVAAAAAADLFSPTKKPYQIQTPHVKYVRRCSLILVQHNP